MSEVLDRLPFAKPERHVDQRMLLSYCRLFPDCEVAGCREWPGPEPHHLIPRGRGRDDRHPNLIRLCGPMHDEWHTGGGRRWLEKYRARLTAEAIAKVERALRIQGE